MYTVSRHFSPIKHFMPPSFHGLKARVYVLIIILASMSHTSMYNKMYLILYVILLLFLRVTTLLCNTRTIWGERHSTNNCYTPRSIASINLTFDIYLHWHQHECMKHRQRISRVAEYVWYCPKIFSSSLISIITMLLPPPPTENWSFIVTLCIC